MRPDIKLSTRFLTTQNAHQIGLLVTVGADRPPRRAPINVALVLDRSGSMTGLPLAAAKRAALRFTELLGTDDRLSVSVFDEGVLTIFGPATAGDPAAAEAIERVQPGGNTNLSAGWLRGREHVQAGIVAGTNRVVLFTDGMANRGITAVPELVALGRGAASQRVTTSCIGFGAEFNEELLRAMSEAGGGNYWYVEAEDQMTDIFAEEIEGLVAPHLPRGRRRGAGPDTGRASAPGVRRGHGRGYRAPGHHPAGRSEPGRDGLHRTHRGANACRDASRSLRAA